MQKINETIDKITEMLEGTAHESMKYCYVDESWTTVEAKQKIHAIKEAIKYHGHLHNQK